MFGIFDQSSFSSSPAAVGLARVGRVAEQDVEVAALELQDDLGDAARRVRDHLDLVARVLLREGRELVLADPARVVVEHDLAGVGRGGRAGEPFEQRGTGRESGGCDRRAAHQRPARERDLRGEIEVGRGVHRDAPLRTRVRLSAAHVAIVDPAESSQMSFNWMDNRFPAAGRLVASGPDRYQTRTRGGNVERDIQRAP